MAMKPTDQEIGELYQEAGASGPSGELDRNILMAARAAVENKAAATTWWSRWRLPLQAVATICLVVMVTVLVERREPLPPVVPPLAMNSNGPAAETPLAESATARPAPGVAESRARMADQAPARSRPEAKRSAAAPAAPAQGQASGEAVPPSAPAGNSIAAESAAAAPMPKPETRAAPSAKAAARLAADQAMSPKDWLDSIQALINQNRLEEARKRLEAFVETYPNEAVPEGIRAKLKADRSKLP
jgi:hypothetical protein